MAKKLKKLKKVGVVFRAFGVGFTRLEIRQMPKSWWLDLHSQLHDLAAKKTGKTR